MTSIGKPLVHELKAPKLVWAAIGVAAAAIGLGLGIGRHDGVWPFVMLAIAPDIALLAGAGPGLEKGQLHPRAVRFYNGVHSLLGPVALAAAALAFGLGGGWLVAAFGWLTHIAVDRAMGYGMRDADGFQRV